MSHLIYDCASHLDTACKPTQRSRVEVAIEQLTAARNEFDTLVVTGVSGLTVGGMVAYAAGLPLTIVRQHYSNHSHRTVEGVTEGRGLFFDDLHCTGATLARVIEQLRLNAPGLQLVGGYYYTGSGLYLANDRARGMQWNDRVDKALRYFGAAAGKVPVGIEHPNDEEADSSHLTFAGVSKFRGHVCFLTAEEART